MLKRRELIILFLVPSMRRRRNTCTGAHSVFRNWRKRREPFVCRSSASAVSRPPARATCAPPARSASPSSPPSSAQKMQKRRREHYSMLSHLRHRRLEPLISCVRIGRLVDRENNEC